MKKSKFLRVDTNSWKLKVFRKMFGIGVGMFKNGCGHSGLRSLKLAVS